MANLTSGQFEKFKPLKMKPEVAQNEKKNFFRVAQVKSDTKKKIFYFLFFGWSFYPGRAHIYIYINFIEARTLF